MHDPDLERLFRAAASLPNEPSDEVPFGFEARVLANWRARHARVDLWNIAGVFRRIALSAVAVTLFAGGAAWWQVRQNDDLDYPTTNAYAIADTAIEAGSWQ